MATRRIWLWSFCSALVLLFGGEAPAQQGPQAVSLSIPATDHSGNVISPARAASNSALATFPYTVVSSRDGSTYSGVMVGQSPFGANLSTTVIDVPLIPVILTTNAVATHITGTGAVVATTKGTTVFDPTAADPCLSVPNDVPLTLLEQSPIFQAAAFNFGGTSVGSSQYIDAFQRANFWKFTAGTGYHTLLNPQTYAPVRLNIPGDEAFALPGNLFGGCGPEAVVNYDYMFQHILPSLLSSEGVNTSQFPILLFQNTVLAIASMGSRDGIVTYGFHAAISSPTFNNINGAPGAPVQTYAFADFQTTDLFTVPIFDADAASHEIGEWMNDPFVGNPTPAWRNVGQCQSNLEVGDPLSGINISTVTGTNGFAYHLQELAFFSWFYGAPSIAANGWFSDNNTLTSDAGPACMKK